VGRSVRPTNVFVHERYHAPNLIHDKADFHTRACAVTVLDCAGFGGAFGDGASISKAVSQPPHSDTYACSTASFSLS
jgi:hypothetical protein